MKKTIILLLSLLVLSISFFSGCTEFDWGDPIGLESSTNTCGIVVIIVVILIVLLLIGLAGAGTKKNIVIQSPPQHIPQPPVIVKQEPKEESKPDRRCPECGHVIPHDAKLCPYCGKKFKKYFKDDVETDEKVNDSKKEEKTSEELSKCM